MNKKGFTLIELLGVIIILSLLALLSSVVITKIVHDSKNDLSDLQLSSIKASAQIWGEENTNKLPESGSCIYITLNNIQDQGLLDENVVDPETSKKISNDLKIKITAKTNSEGKRILEYEVNAGEVIGCNYAYNSCSLANLDGSIDTSDVVTCGTENFYVMSNDGTNVEMLAKYNLDVGNIFIRDWSGNEEDVFDTTTIPSSPTYGMQNEKAVGWKEIDGKDYNYGVLDETEAATVISNYGTLLKGLLSIDELVASVPTAEQMEKLGCILDDTIGDLENAPTWVYGTNYWLTNSMSVGDYGGPYIGPASYTWATMYRSEYGSDESLVLGARPVITILSEYISAE